MGKEKSVLANITRCGDEMRGGKGIFGNEGVKWMNVASIWS